MRARSAALASTAFLGVAISAARDMTDAKARRVFFTSLLYHPVIMALMMLNTVSA